MSSMQGFTFLYTKDRCVNKYLQMEGMAAQHTHQPERGSQTHRVADVRRDLWVHLI